VVSRAKKPARRSSPGPQRPIMPESGRPKIAASAVSALDVELLQDSPVADSKIVAALAEVDAALETLGALDEIMGSITEADRNLLERAIRGPDAPDFLFTSRPDENAVEKAEENVKKFVLREQKGVSSPPVPMPNNVEMSVPRQQRVVSARRVASARAGRHRGWGTQHVEEVAPEGRRQDGSRAAMSDGGAGDGMKVR